MVYTHWTAPQSIDLTGFLPIDPMPRTFPRRDDMGRKAGMTCLAEPGGCLDRFVPRDDAKRQWGKAKRKFKEKFSVWECLTLSGLGALATADMGEERPLCVVGP